MRDAHPFRRRVLWILLLNAVLILIPLSGIYFINLGNSQALQQRAMILRNCNASITKIVSYVTSRDAIATVPVLAPYQRIILIGPAERADSGWRENPGFEWRGAPFDSLAGAFLPRVEAPALTREAIVSRLQKYFDRPAGASGIIDYRFMYSVMPIAWGGGAGASILLFDKSDLMRTNALNKIVLAFVSLVSGLIAVAVSIVYYRLFMRPLFSLTRQARALSDHDHAAPDLFPLRNRKDEIGQLSRAFYQTASALIGRKEAVETFTSDVLHELKNPLTAIRNGVEILEQAGPAGKNTDAREILGLISREAGRIDKLLYDIRELSVYEERPKEEESCRPEEVIREAVTLYRDQGVAAVIRSARRHTLPLPREKFGCIVKNLLDNAVDFSPARGSVTVMYEPKDDGATLTVSDRGRGIPDSEKRRIFQRFYSNRTGEESRGLHSGLGLAIVAAILKSYGAVIDCLENPPSGSRFVVTFKN
jgi:signal transduction histidine kinase